MEWSLLNKNLPLTCHASPRKSTYAYLTFSHNRIVVHFLSNSLIVTILLFKVNK